MMLIVVPNVGVIPAAMSASVGTMKPVMTSWMLGLGLYGFM
jgi:hypothetical protein